MVGVPGDEERMRGFCMYGGNVLGRSSNIPESHGFKGCSLKVKDLREMPLTSL